MFDNNISYKEFKKENNLKIIKKPKKKFYDAILITVAHKSFRLLSKDYFQSLLINKKKGIIFDIKNIFNEKKFTSL